MLPQISLQQLIMIAVAAISGTPVSVLQGYLNGESTPSLVQEIYGYFVGGDGASISFSTIELFKNVELTHLPGIEDLAKILCSHKDRGSSAIENEVSTIRQTHPQLFAAATVYGTNTSQEEEWVSLLENVYAFLDSPKVRDAGKTYEVRLRHGSMDVFHFVVVCNCLLLTPEDTAKRLLKQFPCISKSRDPKMAVEVVTDIFAHCEGTGDGDFLDDLREVDRNIARALPRIVDNTVDRLKKGELPSDLCINVSFSIASDTYYGLNVTDAHELVERTIPYIFLALL